MVYRTFQRIPILIKKKYFIFIENLYAFYLLINSLLESLGRKLNAWTLTRVFYV